MVSFPPCKINLGLHIISKRPDGYHSLETCFYPVPLTDILEVIVSEKFEFTSSGISIPGDPEQNLCIKAYQMLARDHSLEPVKIHLHKIIPIGAGLGGGSSDAAYVIRTLNELFDLNLSLEKMMTYASRIGSDTAFFIQDQPMIGTGRGEVLSPVTVNIGDKFLVLVNPKIHVSTPDAYSGITPRRPERPLVKLLKQPLTEWKQSLTNTFEESVFEKYPVIKTLKEKLYSIGAVYACMSGSGATVFGIFDKEFETARLFPDATVWAGNIRQLKY